MDVVRDGSNSFTRFMPLSLIMNHKFEMSARCNKETKLLKAVEFYLNSSLFVLFGNQQKFFQWEERHIFFFFQVESIKRFLFLRWAPDGDIYTQKELIEQNGEWQP
jgi:hypothetical protein